MYISIWLRSVIRLDPHQDFFYFFTYALYQMKNVCVELVSMEKRQWASNVIYMFVINAHDGNWICTAESVDYLLHI